MITHVRLVIFFICLAYASVSQNYTTRLFATDEGLPDTYIYSVLQDEEGFLWIATGKGLVKFDGQVFTSYDLHAEDGDDIIYSGTLDKNNELWFGTYSGKIYKFDKKKNRLRLYPKNITGSVNKILPSKQNNVLYFFSKGNGVYCLKKNKLEKIENTDNYQVNCMELISDDILLMGTSEGLFTVNGNTGEISPVKGNTAEVLQMQKLEKEKNTFLVSTVASVNKITLNDVFTELKEQKILHVPFKTGDISTFFLNELTNDLYIGTKDEKFSVLDLKKEKLKTIDENDYSASANSVFVDREQNIWVTTTGKGLYRLFKTDFDFVSINGESVFAITQDNDGCTYYGSRHGVVVCDTKGNVLKTIQQAGAKAIDKINALFFDGTNLWIGTDTKGLVIINPKKQSLLNVEFSAIENISINSIKANPYDGDIQVNTNLDGVYTYNNYKLIRHFSVQNSLLHNNIYSSLKSKNKRVYYATHNTSFNFSVNDEIFEVDTKSNGFISDFNAFAEDKNGNIIIATNGDGVYVLNDTTIKPFAFNNKLESKFCNGLVYDSEKNLWIVQRYSLYKYYSEEKILKKIHLNFNNKILFNTNSIYENKKGDLFFGTDKNVVVYENTKAAGIATYLPKSYVVRVKLFDSVITLENNTRFGHGKYNLTFDYSALCLKNSEEVTFRYMLEGRDNNWSEPTKTKEVEFSNLTDGTYTFKVMAISSDGFQEVVPASVSFTINRAFWKNPVFWITVITLLLILFFIILRFRTAALVKAKIRLEAIVDEKTKQLREEKEIVEMNSKVIEEQHHEITQSINYAKRIQEAILPVFEENAAYQPGILVYFQPKDIVSGDFYWHAVKNGRFLIAACDCTGHGVPGAFMSLIGSTLLNKIVLDKGIIDPENILSEIDTEISVSLKQESNEVRDGMENAVCSFDFKNNMLYYAGAKRPLWIFRKKEDGYVLEEFTANKFPIGGFADVKDKVFTAHAIPIAEGDTAYMFSDGIIDQFDHNNKKRLSTKRVRELLHSIVHLPMEQQEKELSDYFNNWKQETQQTDDVLVLGIRV